MESDKSESGQSVQPGGAAAAGAQDSVLGGSEDIPDASDRARIRRALWRQTPEFQRSRALTLVVLGLMLLTGIPGLVLRQDANQTVSNVLLSLAAILLAVGYLVQFMTVLQRRAYVDRQFLAERGIEIGMAADELLRADDDPSTFIAYWKASSLRLESYHAEAGSQLRSAYRLAQITAVAGFLMVSSLGVLAAVTSSAANAAVVGGVAAVGAALSGYIGHTFQSTYERSLLQRMTYFEQPVIAARLLSAERLLARIQEAAIRDQAVLEIVRAAVQFVPGETDASTRKTEVASRD